MCPSDILLVFPVLSVYGGAAIIRIRIYKRDI